MTTTLGIRPETDLDKSAIATYKNHTDAEAAVRSLIDGGVPVKEISIIGRNFETFEDVQGFYRPSDAALSGAGTGAWVGGFFGFMWAAMGFFVIPVVGPLLVLGPLAGLIAGAIGGAGVGALVSALVVSGVPKDEALKYQTRIQAGEFLILVRGTADDIARSSEILDRTEHTGLQTHSGIRW